MEINKLKIKDKFKKSKDYIVLIENIFKQDLDSFLVSFDNQVKAERSFEVLTQIMLDICTHIVASSDISPPTSYADCMFKLGELKVFDTAAAKRFSDIVKMRNIIVHQYDSINYQILYEGLKVLLIDFKEFKEKILTWIENN